MPSSDSQFQFLLPEWLDLFESAAKAESLVYPDARSACFHARRALELAVHWLYKHDASLRLPYQDQLSALIHEPTFRNTVGQAISAKIKVIKDLGNLAVHSHKPVRQFDALTATKELFHVMFWLARTYARGSKPADTLSFNADLLPKTGSQSPQTLEQLQSLKFRGHNTNFCLTPSEDDRRKENSQKISTASPDSGVAGGAINVAVKELTKNRGVPLVIPKRQLPT